MVDKHPSAASLDPLTEAMRPPPDESPVHRAERLRREAEAKQVSDRIDEGIRSDREEQLRRKKNGEVKILLLGQSESGKSTTIKNFHIMYSPNAWRKERIQWRAVIFLNLVRSIRRILTALDEHHLPTAGTTSIHQSSSAFSVANEVQTDIIDNDPVNVSVEALAAALPSTSDLAHTISGHTLSETAGSPGRHSPNGNFPNSYAMPSYLVVLCLRLAPLAHIEALLISALSSDPAQSDFEATHVGNPSLLGPPAGKEMFVSASHWRKVLASRLNHKRSSSSTGKKSTSSHGSSDSDPIVKDDILATLRACKDDMITLWNDVYVRNVLKQRRQRPQDASGFYLNDIARLLERDYVPTDQDVLNARLKTVGVIEHLFAFDRGSEKGINWTLYDVGGARNQRHVWASFFDDVDAIIFLAPISAFNQVLSEDPRVNRVADSLLLFRAICANKLLSKVNIVLFLNKCDILRSKLEAGIQVKKYILSYGDRPNDLEHVSKYFRSKFGAVYRDLSGPNRELYVHLTSVNDPKSTQSIINNVRDMLIKKSLQASSLI